MCVELTGQKQSAGVLASVSGKGAGVSNKTFSVFSVFSYNLTEKAEFKDNFTIIDEGAWRHFKLKCLYSMAMLNNKVYVESFVS